jgi:starvation-inducible outer membrane lipoprotein
MSLDKIEYYNKGIISQILYKLLKKSTTMLDMWDLTKQRVSKNHDFIVC